MKERLLELMNKILQNEKLKGFELLNVESSGNYKEVEYHVRFNLLSPNKKQFCVVTRYLDLDNFSDEEIMGALAHEIAHFYSPPSSTKQRLFVLFFEVYSQRKQQEKIKGSRFLSKLREKEEELLQKLGGSEGIKEQLEEYQKEEDSTDSRAVEWGFGKEIESMRNRGETDIFYFRFIPLD